MLRLTWQDLRAIRGGKLESIGSLLSSSDCPQPSMVVLFISLPKIKGGDLIHAWHIWCFYGEQDLFWFHQAPCQFRFQQPSLLALLHPSFWSDRSYYLRTSLYSYLYNHITSVHLPLCDYIFLSMLNSHKILIHSCIIIMLLAVLQCYKMLMHCFHYIISICLCLGLRQIF